MHTVICVPASIYLLLIITPYTTSWWAVGSHLVMDPNQTCKRARWSRGKMSDICNNKPGLLNQIAKGIALGQTECQYQFRYRRWNCTSTKRSIKKVMLRDTRETGFVNAIIAAGITFQVTRACTKGEQIGCSCSKKKRRKNSRKKNPPLPEGNWEWDGCGENIEFGIKKSKDFLDTRYRRRSSDMKTLVKLHNYVAGRLAVKNNMVTVCKCHGLSGSCTLKTCTRRMPTFREVGNRLKERFDGAAKVIAGNDGQSFMPEGETIKPPGRGDLVYSEESPLYCVPNNTLGSFGTQGRICNDTSQGEEGCGILCCGRGYSTHTEEVKVNCNCTFKYCCEVQCDICKVTERKNICL
ncbi:protein Wnt-6 isoform X1 [Diorhabda carinulata]|uniref:protein Wnt-6 isoform X1 n=2 Tax=Diorhabda carinulata TaxID=1163345 RepID=UPI00259FEBCC|nr:protein Wnt-6 isoform X1 [Diorhabda carinulata]